MIKLVEKIQAIINSYHEMNEETEGEIKTVIQEWTEKIDIHRLEYIKEQIREGVVGLTATSEKINKVFNQKLKTVVSEAKQQVLGSSSPNNKPSDYAALVNNALQFLNIEGESVTDDVAYMILKDFVDDFNQMKLFKSVIEKRVELEDHEGKTIFPKTFGKLNQIEVLLNDFNEIESIANTLFINKRELGKTFIVKGEYYSLPVDGYEQMAGEEAIIQLAKDIEEKANEIFGVGHIEDETKHAVAE